MELTDDSDDSSEDGPQYSAIIQPTLIKQLRKILDQYPADGQILKEIIQNAEDAEASHMRILYDERCVNHDDGAKGKPFKKYFKGPALCVYNDAEFTEEDWQGIQMINSSVKEFDPVKIGRFGLGFKSVFHITDYPMVVSGNNMLVIDPHQKREDRVCITMKLDKMHTYTKQLDVSYCIDALNGIFDFSENTLKLGHFKGTLLRFPLREVKTPLSDNVYNREKILDLFSSFQTEAAVELLFLKCLEEIELYIKDIKGVCSIDQPFFTVRISDSCRCTVREERSEFHSHMKTVGLQPAGKTFVASFNMTIETKSEEGKRTEQEWFVLHCLKGGTMSKELVQLSQDESLSYSPYISIAVPFHEDPVFKGHIFCLMPLPLTDQSLTGFPVHVNGYFALSQDRHHVKWPSADQTGNKTQKDKSIEWNKCLVTEVLADVYFNVIQHLIRTCESTNTVARIYRSIPDHRKIRSNWDLLADPFFEQLLKTPFLYTDNGGGKWIRPDQAVFKIFHGCLDPDVMETVTLLMKQQQIDLVEVPEHVVSVLKDRNFSIHTLTQDFIVKCLKSNASYKSLTFKQKIHIYSYVVYDGDISRLNGLELLPINNGAFSVFGNRNQYTRVIICKDIALFPGQDDSFIRQDLEEEVYLSLFNIARNRKYQLFTLDDLSAEDVANLVQCTLSKHYGTTSERVLNWNPSHQTTGSIWLIKVWQFLQQYNLNTFSHLHLIPNVSQKALYRLSTTFIVRSGGGFNDITDAVSRCLSYLDIIVLESAADEINHHRDIRTYVLLSTIENVFQMLERIQNGGKADQMVQIFNSSVSHNDRTEFVTYISGYSKMNSCLIRLLSSMNLFKEKKSKRIVSVSQVTNIAETDGLPVAYHRESLDCSEWMYKNLATLLNVSVVKHEDVILDILECLKNGTYYNVGQKISMMAYMLNNLNYFHKKDAMIRIARDIPFLYSHSGQIKRALELFEPESQIVQMIVIDKNKFLNSQNLGFDWRILCKLGLKSSSDLTAVDILTCVKYIHERCDKNTEMERSEKVLELIQTNSNLLYNTINGYQLYQHLSNLNFIQPSQRKSEFPASLSWFSRDTLLCKPTEMVDPRYTRLVGSIKPVLRNTMQSNLSTCFGWNREPNVVDVLQQLFLITEHYEDKNKPELLPVISDIYRFLADCGDGGAVFDQLKSRSWIWIGNGFKPPDKIYLTAGHSDISLRPYLFLLPSEFQIQPFLKLFKRMQCIESQNPRLLIRVLEMIQSKYENGSETETIVKADMQLILNILNAVKESTEDDRRGVLLPIKQPDHTRILLKTAGKCNYSKDDDDDWFEGDTCFVHPDISPETAAKLGVPSLTDSLLEDAERLEEWGQHEPLTRRIKDLLKNYKDGLSVPKEIIQNADDAGATTVRFMYDERERDNYGRKLLDKNMIECQGPALWAYNNAKFTNEDLENITKVSGATKEADTTKIGKFGLGFCSVYNLTEIPSFVTGDQMVIFDPHYEYLANALRHKKQPGLKIDLNRNRKILERKSSQFKPFENVFGCSLDDQQTTISYDGTLFRLPLRTKLQAASSEISNLAYDHEQMKSLIQIFVQAGGNLLLFTQNIALVEFYHLPKNESDAGNATLLYSISREVIRTVERPINNSASYKDMSFLKDLARNLKDVKNGVIRDLCQIELSFLLRILIEVKDNLSQFEVAGHSSTTSWFVTWASGTGKSKSIAIQSSVKGVLPLASVACPVQSSNNDTFVTRQLDQLPFGFYQSGHVFCYLPLPVETLLPIHINGSFAVTSDRRRLSCKTTDDKDSFDSEWNEALMCDAVCNAYILFLENLQFLKINQEEEYFKQWPLQYGNDVNNGNLSKLQISFYQRIADVNAPVAVFRRENVFAKIDKCKFLDPALMESQFGEDAFRVCVRMLEDDYTKIMRLPNCLKKCFENSNCESIIKTKMIGEITFYSQAVFPHLTDDVWTDNLKEMLIVYALDNPSEEMCALLKANKCIPTSPHRLYRRPCDIVDTNGSLHELFNVEDERFIVATDNTLTKPNRIEALSKLGMIIHTLSEELLLDRILSIQSLAAVCSNCAIDRCSLLLKYMAREITNIKQKNELLVKLQSMKFLPIKRKQKEWKWSWGGDRLPHDTTRIGIQYVCGNENHPKDNSLHFERPLNLYSQSTEEIVSSLYSILDNSLLPHDIYPDFLTDLGVKKEVDIQVAFANLSKLSEDVCRNGDSSDDLQILNNTTIALYKYIDKITLNAQNDEKTTRYLIEVVKRYRDERIFFLNGTFVKPKQIVVNMTEDCSPILYSLNKAFELRKLKSFLNILGIEEKCSSKRFLDELSACKLKHGSLEMGDSDLKIYVRLLKELVDAAKAKCSSPESFRDLYIPDTNSVLSPIHKLCLDAIDINSTGSMFFTHPTISPDVAIRLGVSTKREQKVKDCSKPLEMYSKEFGQHEELITRINRILSGYPCDVGILKELVQNADDAKASEIHIVLDLSNHPTDNLFADSWKSLQGPAILVYNDSCFSQTDIVGIQSLGVGSKAEDPTKTGQYGVGFNAVYHLTDVPSFLTRGPDVQTGESLCVMDPHCKFVPNATHQCPGRQYINTNLLKEDHPNVFSCYHDRLLMGDKGTIFRLPLRTRDFKSSISSNIVNEDFVNELVSSFKDEMSEMLLFVNSVKKITVSKYEDNQLKDTYSVQLHTLKSDESKILEFSSTVQKAASRIRASLEPGCENFAEVKYMAEVKDSCGKCSKWLIVQRIGFSGEKDLPSKVREAYAKGDIGLLPRGGVALLFDSDQKRKSEEYGRAFCFLPLPLRTYLPVHVNGHFALDHESRRTLWTDDKDDYRSAWNKHLIDDVIVPSYVSALHKLKEILCFDVDNATFAVAVREKLAIYHKYFPDIGKTIEIFKYLVCCFYKWIYGNEEDVFPFCRLITKNDVTIKFYPLTSQEFVFPCVFNTLKKKTCKGLGTVPNVTIDIKDRIANLDQSGSYVSLQDRRLETLVQISKDIGIKLLESPKRIFKSIKEAELPIEELTPEFLISFLQSHNKTDPDKCLIDVGTSIEQTAFRKVQNLQIFIEFCQLSQTFSDRMENLPLNLTNDTILRSFNSESPVFCCSHSSLLPQSPQLFLNNELVRMFTPKQLGLKHFDISSFSNCLPVTLSPERYRTLNRPVEWDRDSKDIPNKHWIEAVWWFLSSEVRKKQAQKRDGLSCDKDQDDKPQNILCCLEPVLPWCLIPCIQRPSSEYDTMTPTYINKLVPVSEAKNIIDATTFSGELKSALQILNLPTKDQNVDFDRNNIVEHLVVKRRHYAALVNLLYEYRDHIADRAINASYCLEIMDFISDHLDSMISNGLEDEIFAKIKQIPLHVSVTGNHVSIPANQSVLVMDDIVVPDGIAEWAIESSTLLLQTTGKITKLYQRLKFTNENVTNIDLYRKHLLPKFNCLPMEYHGVHLIHVRDKLLAKPTGKDFTDEQNRLISVLNGLAFVPDIDENLRTADCFRNPENELLRLMLPESDFPTGEYRTSEWHSFMILSGMQCDITTDMILQFARDIAHAGRNGLSKYNIEDLVNKAKMLLKHVYLRSKIDTNMLKALCEIKFIPPFKVSSWKTDIFEQLDANFLICLRHSTVSVQQDLCWTKCSIIPDWANPMNEYMQIFEEKQKMFDLLEIEKQPSYENVVNHVQNICGALQRHFSTSDTKKIERKIEKLMLQIYEFLQSKLNEPHSKACLQRGLLQMPVLYLPEQKMFVTCNRVVESIKEDEVIKPYLMKAPVCFGMFFRLFNVLGMDSYVSVCNFVRVLAHLHIDVGQRNKPHVNELQIVKAAIENMFNYLRYPMFGKNERKELDLIETLYLLTREGVLQDATSLVYSDNGDFEEKIGNDIGLSYIADLEKLGVKIVGSIPEIFQKLPVNLQPKLLSALVGKRLKENFDVVPLSEEGLQLAYLLGSPQFHQAIIRIAAHSRKAYEGIRPLELNEAIVETWITRLQNIQIIQVRMLELELVFKDTTVGTKELFCYYQKNRDENERNNLFCSFKNGEIKKWLLENSNVFDFAIRHCTDNKFVDVKGLLVKVLLSIDNIEGISILLDRENVEQFSIKITNQASLFPLPGTTVHPDWYRFLDNKFSIFEPGEYVGLLLSEEITVEDKYIPAVYIYAVIMEKCEMPNEAPDIIRDTLQRYKVRVGGGRIEQFRAFDLYKFNRNIEETTKDIALFIDVADTSRSDTRSLEHILSEVECTIRAAWTLPEDERRKIIKRLYKKWHPDKNCGNESISTEVFKFIKQAVINLEQGKDIKRADSFDDFSRNSPFWSHFQTWDRDTRQDTTHQSGPFRSEGQSHHTGGRQYSEPVPSYADAKQWLRQAKRDFTSASQFLPEAEKGHNFNWICFICQQSVEKALKAMHYQKDANKIPDSHNLEQLTVGLDPELQGMVTTMITTVGKPEKMMYPDRHRIPKIPAEEYDKQNAEDAIRLTKQIVEYTADRF